MAKRSAKPPKASGTSARWWEEAEEVPRAGLPDADRLAKRAKRLRMFVWAAIVLFPISAITNFVLAASPGDATRPVAAAATAFRDTKGVAMVEVRKWLAQSPSPVPGGVLVDWVSAKKKRVKPDAEAAPEEIYFVEVHNLTVADANGSLYDVAVSLGVSDYIGATLIGAPSLTPVAPSDLRFRDNAWPGLDSTRASDEAIAAIATWATAYSSGDPQALRASTGDANLDRSYVPLNGATLMVEEMLIGEAAAIYDPETPVEEQDPDATSTIVVRVEFPIRWQGTFLRDGEEWPTVTYDLLLRNADTATPSVAAWGGPGSGPSLRPFSNAVEYRAFTDENETPDEDTSVVGTDEAAETKKDDQ